jgi:hypothetical protein
MQNNKLSTSNEDNYRICLPRYAEGFRSYLKGSRFLNGAMQNIIIITYVVLQSLIQHFVQVPMFQFKLLFDDDRLGYCRKAGDGGIIAINVAYFYENKGYTFDSLFTDDDMFESDSLIQTLIHELAHLIDPDNRDCNDGGHNESFANSMQKIMMTMMSVPYNKKQRAWAGTGGLRKELKKKVKAFTLELEKRGFIMRRKKEAFKEKKYYKENKRKNLEKLKREIKKQKKKTNNNNIGTRTTYKRNIAFKGSYAELSDSSDSDSDSSSSSDNSDSSSE